MAVTIEPGGPVIIDFDAAASAVAGDVERAIKDATQSALNRIQDAWYGGGLNPGRQHADGSETEAEGRSAHGWEITRADYSGGSGVVELYNSVEYSQYVHPSGAPGAPNHDTEGNGPGGKWGESGGNAYTQFEHEMTQLEERIDQIVRDALADL